MIRTDAFYCTTKRDGGPENRRFYLAERTAREAMLRAMRNGAQWAEYGWGLHTGAGDFSPKRTIERREG